MRIIFLFVCLVLFFLYSERLLSQRKLLGPKQGGFMPPTYLVGPWLYLIHILVDWPFVACWKAIKAMTARMTALQVHPFSFPSLLSSETDIIRKSNAMAAGVPASFFLSFFFPFRFYFFISCHNPGSLHSCSQANHSPVGTHTSVTSVSLVLCFLFEFTYSNLSCFCYVAFKLERDTSLMISFTKK